MRLADPAQRVGVATLTIPAIRTTPVVASTFAATFQTVGHIQHLSASPRALALKVTPVHVFDTGAAVIGTPSGLKPGRKLDAVPRASAARRESLGVVDPVAKELVLFFATSDIAAL